MDCIPTLLPSLELKFIVGHHSHTMHTKHWHDQDLRKEGLEVGHPGFGNGGPKPDANRFV